MAWFSMLPWATDTTGDGTDRYTEERSNEFFRIFDVRDEEAEGVVLGRWDEFAVSGTSSPLTVAAGAAICYGRVWNDEASTVVVPTPLVGTTGGRVVLRADWTAKTIRPAVKMSANGDPSIPALQQDAGDVWEISLATIQADTIETGAAVAVTDDRTFQQPLLLARQGGSATDWGAHGTTDYTPKSAFMQAGVVRETALTAAETVSKLVTFPVEFAAKPIVMASVRDGNNGELTVLVPSATQCELAVRFAAPLGLDGFTEWSWLAIGPRK
jgi:hypothetical protein